MSEILLEEPSDSDSFAFPRPFSECEKYTYPAQDGMEIRDYFAAMAVQALCADFTGPDSPSDPEKYIQWHASLAYRIADAMMKEREKKYQKSDS